MLNKTKYAISLGLLLSVLWIAFSGHYTSLLLLCGLISVVLVILLALRMDIVDNEGHPFHLHLPSLFAYSYWLLKQIFISNIYVLRLLLKPSLQISPKIIVVPNSQSSDLTRFILANSITLTPSTLTIDVDADTTTVHALTEQAAHELLQGAMGKKVATLEREI